MKTFDFIQGTAPLLISMPHCGTDLPKDIAGTMSEHSLTVADTDWHVDKLYAFAEALGASIIRPHVSRYVIDLNRPADNAELYPGANGTDLCPVSNFAEENVYKPGKEPGEEEIQRRLNTYWHPYHEQVQAELARIKEAHGVAVLFEAHSIRSLVPRLFQGRLPDLNIGTAAGKSCAPSMLQTVETVLSTQENYSCVINQRFKGGYITRAYGQPQNNIHALQLELSQRTYMQERMPFDYLPERAQDVQPLLKKLLRSLIGWAETQAQTSTQKGEQHEPA